MKKKGAKAQIEKWVSEAQNKFNLCEWTFILDWSHPVKEEHIFFRISCNHNNFEAQIRANLPHVLKMPDWYIRRACFHEVAHAFLWELSELATERFVNETQVTDAIEKVVERLACLLSEV